MKNFYNNEILRKNIILSKEKNKSSIKINNTNWTIQEDKLLLKLVDASEKK